MQCPRSWGQRSCSSDENLMISDCRWLSRWLPPFRSVAGYRLLGFALIWRTDEPCHLTAQGNNIPIIYLLSSGWCHHRPFINLQLWKRTQFPHQSSPSFLCPKGLLVTAVCGSLSPEPHGAPDPPGSFDRVPECFGMPKNLKIRINDVTIYFEVYSLLKCTAYKILCLEIKT